MAPDPDESNFLDKKATKRIQPIVGNMLYYARSVDPTMLWAINENFRVQSQPTRDTVEKSRILIEYASTYPNAILSYEASDIFLHVDSDPAYLTMPDSRSFYSGHFYFSDWPSPSPIKPNPERNGPIHSVKQSENLCPIQRKLKHVVPSTTEKQLSACDQL